MKEECEVVIAQEPHNVSIKVLRHTLQSKEPIECRSFLTNGLRAINNHREIVYTFKLTDAELQQIASRGEEDTFDPTRDFPPGLMSLYEGIIGYATQGQLANGADMTTLDPVRGPGLFGCDNFRGILYIPSTIFGLPRDALQGLVLTREEVDGVKRVGPIRVMAAMGDVHRFFPSALWIDTQRESYVQGDEWIETSKLTQLGVRPHVTSKPSAFVYFQRSYDESASREDHNNPRSGLTDYTWTCPSATARGLLIYNEHLRTVINQNREAILGDSDPLLALFTFPTNKAMRVLSYPFDPASRDGAISAISHQAAGMEDNTLTMLGNFVILIQTAENGQIGANLVEDGLIVFVSSLAAVFDAISEGANFTLDGKDDLLSFQITFDKEHTGFTEAQPEYHPQGNGEEHQQQPQEEETGIQMANIQLLQPDDECERAFSNNYGEGISKVSEMVQILDKGVKALPMFQKPNEPAAKSEQGRSSEDASATSSFTPDEVKTAFGPIAMLIVGVELTPNEKPQYLMTVGELEDPSKERQAIQGTIIDAMLKSATEGDDDKPVVDSLSKVFAAVGDVAPTVSAPFKFEMNFKIQPDLLFA